MVSTTLLWEDILYVLQVMPFTLGVAAVILTVGVLVALMIASVRINQTPVARVLARIFIDYTRGIPLVIHLYIAYFLLPGLLKSIGQLMGISIQAEPIAVLIVAYSLYISVGQSENIRGAFYSVDAGQWDAAFACGLSGGQALSRIVIPQGLTVALPVVLNSYLGVIKGLSLAFTIGVPDILSQARVASAQNYGYLEAYIAAALVYWVLCGALSTIFSRLEKTLTKW